MSETLHGKAAGFTAVGTLTHDNLFAGETPAPVTGIVTIDAGTLVRGTVLGQITSGGKYIQSLSDAVDGSETPAAILLEDVDASGGDKEAAVAFSGVFNIAALTIGASHTAASIEPGLRARQIYLRNNVAA